MLLQLLYIIIHLILHRHIKHINNVVVVVVSLYFLQKYENFQQNVYHIKIMKGTRIRVQRKTNKQ